LIFCARTGATAALLAQSFLRRENNQHRNINMKLIDIKPLDRGHTTGGDIPNTTKNEELGSMEPAVRMELTTTTPDMWMGAESEIDAAVSRVFAAVTIQDKINLLADAMQVTTNIILRGTRQ
jgi:hypothetical protein